VSTLAYTGTLDFVTYATVYSSIQILVSHIILKLGLGLLLDESGLSNSVYKFEFVNLLVLTCS